MIKAEFILNWQSLKSTHCPDLKEKSHFCLLHSLNPPLHDLAALLQMVSVILCEALDVIHLLFLLGRHFLTHLPLLLLQHGVEMVKLLAHLRLLPPAILLGLGEGDEGGIRDIGKCVRKMGNSIHINNSG